MRRIPRPQLGDLTGAFGDLGTLLPLAAGLVVVAGVSPGGFFIAFGIATLRPPAGGSRSSCSAASA